jgi:hypothetical protein
MHTVELAYTPAQTAEMIATFVSKSWSLILVPPTVKSIINEVHKASLEAMKETGIRYKVALHDPQTLSIIVKFESFVESFVEAEVAHD